MVIARRLAVSEFGVWHFLSSALTFFTFTGGFVCMWIIRYTARGHRVAKTGVLINLSLTVPLFLVFLLLSPVLAGGLGTEDALSIHYFYLAAPLIPLMSLMNSLSAVAYGRRPQYEGYGLIVFELSKLLVCLLLLVFFNLGLYGVLSALIAAYSLQCLFYLYNFRDEWREGFKAAYAKKWLLSSWIVFYSAVGSIIIGLDRFFVGLLTDANSLAMYGAAYNIASLMGLSLFLIRALYPKLLGEEDRGKIQESVETSLRFLLMLSTPMLLGSFVLGRQIVTILGSKYLEGLSVFYILALAYFLSCLSSFSTDVIGGVERVDADLGFSQKELLRSGLFISSSFLYLYAAIFVPLLLILVPPYGIVGGASAVAASYAVLALVNNVIAHRRTGYKFPVKAWLRYLACSLAMAGVVWLVSPVYTVETVGAIVLGIAIYFSLLYAVDKEVRLLVRALVAAARLSF